MYTIMLVEDETTVREGIVKKINWQAHSFVLAGAYENGRQAADALSHQPVDVVVTDINMPVMDGLALAAYVHKTTPETIVVILTGFGDFSYAQSAIKYRVHEYILKPITARQLRELLDKLRQELDSRHARHQGLEAMKDNLEQAYPLMRKQFLTGLCSAEIAQDEARRRAEELSLSLAGPQFCAALLDVQPGTVMSRSTLAGAVRTAAYGDSTEVFADSAGRTVLLLSGDAPVQAVQGIVQTLRQERRQQAFSCSIGEAVEQLGRVCKSYNRAAQAWEYLYHMGTGSIVMSAEILARPPEELDSSGLRRAVLRSAKLCNQAQAAEDLENLFAALKAAHLPRESCLQHLQKLALRLGEYAEEEHLEGISHSDALERLTAQPTIYGAQYILSKYLRTLIQTVLSRSDSTGRQAALAVDYIQENYQDTALSLQKLTAYLCVSTSHFSQIFKSYTGVTFVDFLTRLRMDRARELLATTDMKNYEIAYQVGYDDPGYFSSAFKKFAGMKPSDYRRRYRPQEGGGAG